MASFDILDLLQNHHATVTISGDVGSGTVREFMNLRAIFLDDEVALGIGTQYTEDAFQAVAGGTSALREASEAVLRMVGSEKTMKSQILTNIGWAGADHPSFSLQLLFLSLGQSGSDVEVMNPVKALARALYPTKVREEGIASSFFSAPLGYTAHEGSPGLLSIAIGSWFLARNMLIESVAPTFSTTLSKPEGAVQRPMWATAQVTFKHFQVPMADTVMDWFK